jgi:serine protease Do
MNLRFNKNYPESKPYLQSYLGVIIVTAVISSLVVSAGLYWLFSRTTHQSLDKKVQALLEINQKVPSSSNQTVAVAAGDNSSPVAKIAQKTGTTVVGIRTSFTAPANEFFADRSASGSEGSGVIISKDGYIMTNYHVVAAADPRAAGSQNTALEVFLADKRQVKAKFIGGDQLSDLAVIQVAATNLPVAQLGDSAKLHVGDLAVAIGNPLGMEFAGSVTAGVISALNRSVAVEDKTLNLIQTDAAINPGNSGGALVNANGEVIGINTVKISVSGVEGLGFAIPINDAKPIVSQLIMYGYVKGRPFIGITGQDITEAISQYYGLPLGVYVTGVTPQGGAADCGIRKGDIITKLAGAKTTSMQDIANIKKKYKAGDTVEAEVRRGNKTIALKLQFTEER